MFPKWVTPTPQNQKHNHKPHTYTYRQKEKPDHHNHHADKKTSSRRPNIRNQIPHTRIQRQQRAAENKRIHIRIMNTEQNKTNPRHDLHRFHNPFILHHNTSQNMF